MRRSATPKAMARAINLADVDSYVGKITKLQVGTGIKGAKSNIKKKPDAGQMAQSCIFSEAKNANDLLEASMVGDRQKQRGDKVSKMGQKGEIVEEGK